MTGQNTTNDNELSLGLLRQRRILILISIILSLFIYGIVSIENIEMLSGINIDVEQLYIKSILVVLLVYFWVRYWQYEKVDAKCINLVGQMKKKIKNARKEFFKNIACPNIKDCFDVEHCNIKEKKDLPKSKNNSWFCRKKCGFTEKNIETHGVAYRYENYYADSNHNVEAASEEEIERIKQEGWQLVEKNSNADSRIDPIFTKVFPYNWLILEIVLFCIKVKFYFTSAYFTDYLLPYYLAAIAFFVFIADFFAFSAYIAVLLAIILMIFKNSKYCQKIPRKIKQIISSNECAKKYLALCAK